jgi:hypothetical protein
MEYLGGPLGVNRISGWPRMNRISGWPELGGYGGPAWPGNFEFSSSYVQFVRLLVVLWYAHSSNFDEGTKKHSKIMLVLTGTEDLEPHRSRHMHLLSTRRSPGEVQSKHTREPTTAPFPLVNTHLRMRRVPENPPAYSFLCWCLSSVSTYNGFTNSQLPGRNGAVCK